MKEAKSNGVVVNAAANFSLEPTSAQRLIRLLSRLAWAEAAQLETLGVDSMEHEQQRYLQLLNDVEVTPAQLAESLLRNAAPSAGNFGELTMTKVSFAVAETSKAPSSEVACHMRLLALFALIGRKENIGWEWAPSFPFSSEDPVLKAASTVPLVTREGGITFQPDVFAATLEGIQPTPN